MELRRVVCAVVVLACSALVAAGCGGRSTKDWVTSVNALCDTYNGRIEKGLSGSGGGDRSKQLQEVLPVVDEFVAKVKDEELPSDKTDQSKAQDYVDSLQDTAGALHDVSAAAAAKDNNQAMTALSAMMKAGTASDKVAKDLGLTRCVNSGGSAASTPAGGDAGTPPTAATPPVTTTSK